MKIFCANDSLYTEHLVSALSQLKILERLHTTNILTDFDIGRIAANCPLLSEVTLPKCLEGDGGVIALSKLPLKHLEMEFFYDTKMLTDEGLKQLASNCKTLETLILSKASAITNEAVLIVIKANPKLHTLHLKDCMSLDMDKLFDAIWALPCTNLRWIFCSKGRRKMEEMRNIEPNSLKSVFQ